MITEDECRRKKICIHIAMGKETINKRKFLLIRSFEKAFKKRIIKSLVWSVALYEAETWHFVKNR